MLLVVCRSDSSICIPYPPPLLPETAEISTTILCSVLRHTCLLLADDDDLCMSLCQLNFALSRTRILAVSHAGPWTKHESNVQRPEILKRSDHVFLSIRSTDHSTLMYILHAMHHSAPDIRIGTGDGLMVAMLIPVVLYNVFPEHSRRPSARRRVLRLLLRRILRLSRRVQRCFR